MGKNKKIPIIGGMSVGVIIITILIAVSSNLITDQVKKLAETPEVSITNVEYYRIPNKGWETMLNVIVFNKGNISATGCSIHFTDDVDPIEKRSNPFNVESNKEKSITITTAKYEESRDYVIKSYVTCDNFAQSNIDTRTIPIP